MLIDIIILCHRRHCTCRDGELDLRWLAAELPVDDFHHDNDDNNDGDDDDGDDDDDDKVDELPREEHVVTDPVLSKPNLTAVLKKKSLKLFQQHVRFFDEDNPQMSKAWMLSE